jgi:hypothetical protein
MAFPIRYRERYLCPHGLQTEEGLCQEAEIQKISDGNGKIDVAASVAGSLLSPFLRIKIGGAPIPA